MVETDVPVKDDPEGRLEAIETKRIRGGRDVETAADDCTSSVPGFRHIRPATYQRALDGKARVAVARQGTLMLQVD
jgi:hypothetical protein